MNTAKLLKLQTDLNNLVHYIQLRNQTPEEAEKITNYYNNIIRALAAQILDTIEEANNWPNIGQETAIEQKIEPNTGSPEAMEKTNT